MEKAILAALNKCVEMKWITINDNLRPEVIAGVIIDVMKEMPLKDALQAFFPRELY